MDNDSMLSEEDYAAHITFQNNINEDIVHSSPPSNVLLFDFVLPPSQTLCVSNEDNPGLTLTIDIITSMEPSPPMAIPYSANVPADPTLWDGNFMATSLFSTNEFLNSDINNISCSLQCMACFLRQRNLEGHNRNNIKQLDPFGQSGWNFILAIFKSGWDILTTANESTIRSNIAKEFGKAINPPSRENIRHGTHISKIPLFIPPRPSKKVLEKSKALQRSISTKGNSNMSYAQAASYVINTLKIKEAFPALPNKKVLEMHNAAFAQPVNKTKKVQYTTKEPSRKQTIILVPNNLAENIMGNASIYIFQINALLKNVKSSMHSEFICPCSGRITIITNNVPNPNDLSVVEKYFKSVEGINSNDIPSPQLPQSKSYLKITGFPYL